MMGLASAARRVVVAARWNHHGALITASGPQLAKTSAGTAVGVHVRTLSTASGDAHTMKAAHARIAKKMAANHRFNYIDDETMELKKESLAQFLESRLHMDRLVAMRTIALHPPLIAYSHETLERKLDWLTRLGLTKEAVQKLIRCGPMIFTHSEESLERTKQWILDQGIAPSRVPFFFLAAPQLTGLSNENRNHKVEFLRSLGLGENEIRRALVQFPRLIAITVENMASKVEGVKSLGLTDDDVAKLITLVPQFLALNMDSIHRKLQAIDEMFGEGEGVRLWLAHPRLLMRNTEELRRTFEYLTKVVGMTPDRISGNVHLIMRNVDRLVRPRYEYLTKVQSRDLEGVNWILQPETKFVSRHPDYTDFRGRNLKPK